MTDALKKFKAEKEELEQISREACEKEVQNLLNLLKIEKDNMEESLRKQAELREELQLSSEELCKSEAELQGLKEEIVQARYVIVSLEKEKTSFIEQNTNAQKEIESLNVMIESKSSKIEELYHTKEMKR